ncbi:extracellular solute-binding protein [Streptomyces albus subsp. chlorinus]|uniref:extracellular solute-binding protein n=1 Tax=Streptomyces albus TaxID=1888 RepID=UPI00156E487D|nr:extracellular solute-binding protein [Streptomyces albus]NSC22430.1 extracellular solute-binding protein [Streptomyces albus subsp. chlorinus]
MRRRRFLGMAAAGAVGAAGVPALTGCGKGPGSADVTLRLVAADYGSPGAHNSSKVYWRKLADAFAAENPGIKVDVTVHSWNEIGKKLTDMVDAGDPPDLAQVDSYANWAAEGKLYKVSELLPIPAQAEFLTSLAEAGEVRRVQYGLPFVASTRVLFYNKDLFAKAGLNPKKPPRSWDELKSAARTLKQAGVKIPYGLPLGPEEAQGEALMWMLGNGGSYVDSVGNYTINSPENIETMEWLRDNLVTPGYTEPDPQRVNRQKLFDAFTAGEVAVLNGHPTLMQQADKKGISYGTGKLPGRGGPAEGTLGVADWMMAFREHGHREECGKFLSFVYEEKNHYDFVSQYGLLPVTTSASERMRADEEQKKLWPFLDQLSSAEFYPVGKVSWAGTTAGLKKTIGQAAMKGGDPRSVLTALQREADAAEKAGS